MPSDSVQTAFQQEFMPTAILFSRVSSANAFCSVVCDPEFDGSASILKSDIVHACQSKFQYIIGAFQDSRDAARSSSATELQRFASEFDVLCVELNVRVFPVHR